MNKNIFITYIIPFMLVLVLTANASAPVVMMDTDYPIMPIANTVSGYTVQGFASYLKSAGQITYSTVDLTSGTYVYFGYWQSYAYGFRISLPSTSSSGYLTVTGLTPMAYGRTSQPTQNATWTTSTSSTSFWSVPLSYCLSGSSSSLYQLSDIEQYGSFPSYDGTVYVPAHTDTLYLYIFSTFVGAGIRSGYWFNPGLYMLNPSIMFTPDYHPPEYTSQLNTLISSVNGISSYLPNLVSPSYTTHLNDIISNMKSISDQLSQLTTPSAMSSFESAYIERMQDQLNKTENLLTAENPALPNNGDIAGFAEDVQNGLGLSGSSFSSDDFAEAAAGYGGSSGTSAGGPWEFFTQAVADSLSGDTMTVGLNDDDYIYAWMDETQRRWSLWN